MVNKTLSITENFCKMIHSFIYLTIRNILKYFHCHLGDCEIYFEKSKCNDCKNFEKDN